MSHNLVVSSVTFTKSEYKFFAGNNERPIVIGRLTISHQTLYLPRYSIEQGRTAVCPDTTVTLTIGTSKAGSKPETEEHPGNDQFTVNFL